MNNCVVKCSNCDKELAEVNSKECGYRKKIVFTCPFCFDRSFQKEIDGQYSIFVPDGVEILDLDDEDADNGLVMVYLTETYNG